MLRAARLPCPAREPWEPVRRGTAPCPSTEESFINRGRGALVGGDKVVRRGGRRQRVLQELDLGGLVCLGGLRAAAKRGIMIGLGLGWGQQACDADPELMRPPGQRVSFMAPGAPHHETDICPTTFAARKAVSQRPRTAMQVGMPQHFHACHAMPRSSTLLLLAVTRNRCPWPRRGCSGARTKVE
jgi:hypothetical protein